MAHSPPDDAPLDPDSPEGRAVAARLARTLAEIELELAAREAARPQGESGPLERGVSR